VIEATWQTGPVQGRATDLNQEGTAMQNNASQTEELFIEELSIEELDEVAAAGTLGTASTLSTPASTAATFGSH
jgi:hypothetical protein